MLRAPANCATQVLRRFEQSELIQLDVPLPVRDLMLAALQLEEAAGRWQVSTTAALRQLAADCSSCSCAETDWMACAAAQAWQAGLTGVHCLQPEDGPHEDIADLVVELIGQKAAMLAEYFGLHVGAELQGARCCVAAAWWLQVCSAAVLAHQPC